jgi:putative membrane protein
MSRIRTRWAVTAAALAVAATPGAAAVAGDGDGHDGHAGHLPAAAAQAPVDAQTFVVAATQGNAFEIRSSRIALRRSDDDGVRSIARHLIADHTAAQRQLRQLAGTLGLSVPPANPNARQQAVIERLRSGQRSSFDRRWLRAQLAAHEESIATFRNTGINEANPEPIRDLIVATLPVLGRHLGELMFAREHH